MPGQFPSDFCLRCMEIADRTANLGKPLDEDYVFATFLNSLSSNSDAINAPPVRMRIVVEEPHSLEQRFDDLETPKRGDRNPQVLQPTGKVLVIDL